MRILSFTSLLFFASGLLGFGECGKSEDVSVFTEMLQEFQERVFERIDNMEREMKEKLAKKVDKVFQLYEMIEFFPLVPPESKLVIFMHRLFTFFRY